MTDPKQVDEAIEHVVRGITHENCFYYEEQAQIVAAEVERLRKEIDERDKITDHDHEAAYLTHDLLSEAADLREKLAKAEAERDTLLAWKEAELSVEAQWDVQAIGKLLDVPLGHPIRPAIQPWIEKLRAENQAVSKALGAYPDSNLASLAESLEARNRALESENQALRDEAVTLAGRVGEMESVIRVLWAWHNERPRWAVDFRIGYSVEDEPELRIWVISGPRDGGGRFVVADATVPALKDPTTHQELVRAAMGLAMADRRFRAAQLDTWEAIQNGSNADVAAASTSQSTAEAELTKASEAFAAAKAETEKQR